MSAIFKLNIQSQDHISSPRAIFQTLYIVLHQRINSQFESIYDHNTNFNTMLCIITAGLDSKENSKRVIYASYQVLNHIPTIGPGPKSAALDGSY